MKDLRAFAGRAESVASARQFTREILRDRAPDVVDAVELMISELATNSVRHAHSDFEVMVDASSEQIRVEVRDLSDTEPTPRSPSQHDTSGRGLQIVKALSDTWGVTPSRTGKTVWFVASQPLSSSAPSAAAEPAGPTGDAGTDGHRRPPGSLMIGRALQMARLARWAGAPPSAAVVGRAANAG